MIVATELALVAALKQAGDDDLIGYKYAVAETFPDELDEYLANAVNLRTPACWAVFLGMADGDDNGDDTGWFGKARFAVVVAAQNYREEEDTRHGDGVQPGSYQLAVDAVRILSRNWLVPVALVRSVMVRGFRPVARSAAMAKQGLSMMAIEIDCGLPLGLLPEPDPAPFDTLHVDWDVPPIGNVDRDLPSANPDAEDEMEVPQ